MTTTQPTTTTTACPQWCSNEHEGIPVLNSLPEHHGKGYGLGEFDGCTCPELWPGDPAAVVRLFIGSGADEFDAKMTVGQAWSLLAALRSPAATTAIAEGIERSLRDIMLDTTKGEPPTALCGRRGQITHEPGTGRGGDRDSTICEKCWEIAMAMP